MQIESLKTAGSYSRPSCDGGPDDDQKFDRRRRSTFEKRICVRLSAEIKKCPTYQKNTNPNERRTQMKTQKLNLLLLPVSILAASIIPALAFSQVSPNVTVVATGLQGPRGLKFGPDGLLYVAEAGTGGTADTVGKCPQVSAPVGPYHNGNTSRISRIDPQGNRTTVASGFPSAVTSQTPPDIIGVADVAFLHGELYALLSGGGCAHGNAAIPSGIAKIDRSNGSWKVIADLSSFVTAYPAAYPDPVDAGRDPDGTFYSLIVHKDRFYAVEANQGEILSADTDGKVRRDFDVSAAEGHIVPTSLAERNGLFYVGSLSIFPIVVDAAQIITLSREDRYYDFAPGLNPDDGKSGKLKLISSKAGFATIVSTAFGPDGLLYVLELSAADGYPTPGFGKVVRIRCDGEIEDVATGLSVPTGMTFGPDGNLYVSNLGAAPAGAGQIVRITVN